MEQCSICIDDLDNPKNIVELDCGHKFHYDCIIKVKNNSCPYCRAKLVNETCCNEKHDMPFFYTGFIKKNGYCIICKKKTYKYFLKDKIIEKHETDQYKTKTKTSKKYLKIFKIIKNN